MNRGLFAALLAVAYGCGAEASPKDAGGVDASGETATKPESGTGPHDASTVSDGGSASDVANEPVEAGPPPDDSAVQLCVDTINQYRATLALPPYERWKADESCTDGQALADSKSGTPHSAFGKCGEYAQNECPGWPGPPGDMIPTCLAMMWAEGPGPFAQHGHYVNMSSTQYTMVSCGFATAADGSIWATQDFK